MQDTTHKLHHLLPPERAYKCLRHKMKYELPTVRTDRFKNSQNKLLSIPFASNIINNRDN